MSNKEELLIKLKKPISIAVGGELKKFNVLTVGLPTIKSLNLWANVKKACFGAVTQYQKDMGSDNGEETEDKDEAKSDILPLDLFLATGKFEELQESVDKYLLAHSSLDGNPLSKSIIGKFSIEDYKKILEKTSYFLFSN